MAEERGLQIKWETPAEPKPDAPAGSDVPAVLGMLGGLVDLRQVRGGELLAQRLEELKNRENGRGR